MRSDDPALCGVNGRTDYVRAACEGSLRRLRVDTIDLYYQHRVDPNVPNEETVGAMAELVAQG
jgi:aryl-alcohol dehydrogenase-like predicted oxidoreductase